MRALGACTPALQMVMSQYRPASIVFYWNFLRVLENIRIDSIDDGVPLATRHFEDEVIQTTTAEDVNMIAGIGSTPRIEAIGFMGHFVSHDRDSGRVVAREFPTFVAHVSGGEKVDGPIAFAHDDSMVNKTVRC